MRKIDYNLIFLLILFIIIQLIVKDTFWWDEGVYIGMAKYLASFGKMGLWEHIRPVTFPFLISLGFNFVIWAKIIIIFSALGSIFLTYKIAKYYDRDSAIYAALFLAFTPIFFLMSSKIYPDILVVFFILAGYYSMLKNKKILSGVLFGIAFLTKFPAGIFILIPFFHYKKLNKYFYVVGGFLILTILYLIINYIAYGNMFTPILDAKTIITQVLGCNIINYHPWYYYFIELFKQNIFLILLFLAIPKITLLMSVILPLIYFLQLHCRDIRYSLLFLPFLAILAAKPISKLKKFYIIPLVILIIFSINYSIMPQEGDLSYYSFKTNGTILTTNPLIAIYNDNLIEKAYYPVYNKNLSQKLLNSLDKQNNVFIDNCGGGFICPLNDTICLKNNKKILSYLNNSKLKYNKTIGRCYYLIK